MYCPLCAEEIAPGRERCTSCDAPVQAGSSPEPTPRHAPEPPAWTPPPPMAPPAPGTSIGPARPEDAAGTGGQHATTPSESPEAAPPDEPAARQVRAGDARQRGTVARGPVGSDWRGAAVCVLATVSATYLLGLVLTLFYATVSGSLSGRALVTLPAAGVATAFGATWGLHLGTGDLGAVFGTGGDLAYQIRAYPLLLTVVGVWVCGRWGARRFAAGHASGALLERMTQGARVGLLLGAATFVFALASAQSFGASGRVSARYPLAFVGGLVVGGLTMTVVSLRHDPGQAPPGLRRLGATLGEPLVALRFTLPMLVLAGVVELLGVLVFGGTGEDLSLLGLDSADTRSAGAALLVPFAPNAAWMVFGLVMGAPLTTDTGIGFQDGRQTSLVELARDSPLWWFAPLLVLLVLFGAGVLLALRSPSAHAARNRVGVWALVFGAASLALCALGAVTLHLRFAFSAVNASIGNDPALVLVLSCTWALLTGLGAVALVARLGPAKRERWARAVRAPGHPDGGDLLGGSGGLGQLG